MSLIHDWRIRRLARRIGRLYRYRESFEWYLPPSWMTTTAKIDAAERKLAGLTTRGSDGD